jgi:hypothetical protein
MARHLAPAAVLVFFFTILIAMTTELPFWAPLCVLSFNWIGAPLIGSRLERSNPSLDHQEQKLEGFAWKIFTAFAYVLLIGATALAFNSIVIDVEDNEKGGWLNP